MTADTRLSAYRWLSLAILALLFGPIAMARAQLNVVYTESNIGSIPNGNSVYGYSNSGGILTPLPGSPYLTNGTGVYDPGGGSTEFDADHQVIFGVNDETLLAVNGHTNTIASFAVNSDGSLTAESGSPFSSEGQDPVSLSLLGYFFGRNLSWLGVVNKNEDPNQNQNGAVPNLSVFKLNAFGKPQPIARGTLNLTADSSPAEAVALCPHFCYVFVGLFQGPSAGISSYLVPHDGKLYSVSFAGPPVSGATVLGMALEATTEEHRYVYVGLPSLSEVGVYQYDFSGAVVSFLRAVANQGSGVGWMVANAASTYLYTAESDSGTVTVYSLAHPGTPVQVQHVTLGKSPGVDVPAPANLAFDPTGAYLYCLDNVHSVLHVLSVDASTGLLTEPNPPTVLPSPSGEEALGLATAMIPY